MKDTGTNNKTQRMYQMNFKEPRVRFKYFMHKSQISLYEDKKFGKIMEDQIVKVGNDYKTPLQVTNLAITLPHNRGMTERQGQYLKQRFQRN